MFSRKTALSVAVALLIASASEAQPAPGQTPRFEVATVKTSPPPAGDLINIDLGTVRNGKLTMANASLSDCLRFAYGLVSDAQIAGPEWIKSKQVRFDIVAQAPPDTPRDQFPLMLQPLLAERLKLTFHYEQKELPFLALVPAKNGPKVHAAKAGATPATAPRSGAVFTAGKCRCKCGRPCCPVFNARLS